MFVCQAWRNDCPARRRDQREGKRAPHRRRRAFDASPPVCVSKLPASIHTIAPAGELRARNAMDRTSSRRRSGVIDDDERGTSSRSVGAIERARDTPAARLEHCERFEELVLARIARPQQRTFVRDDLEPHPTVQREDAERRARRDRRLERRVRSGAAVLDRGGVEDDQRARLGEQLLLSDDELARLRATSASGSSEGRRLPRTRAARRTRRPVRCSASAGRCRAAARRTAAPRPLRRTGTRASGDVSATS